MTSKHPIILQLCKMWKIPEEISLVVDKPSSELLSAAVSEPQDEVGDVVHASVGQVHLLIHL